MLAVTNVTMRNKDRDDRSSRMKVFLFPKGENVLENLERRRNRPVDEWRGLLPEALTRAGFTDVEETARTAKWSQKAGCSCGCSPGFLLGRSSHQDLYVDFVDVTSEALRALQVVTKDARLRAVLEAVDPKALEQCRAAVLAAGLNPDPEVQ